MSIFPATPASADDDHRPQDQRERAADAHLSPDEAATQAHAGTPSYGDFGKPENACQNAGAASTSTSSNDGSNDNPDEFSEFRRPSDAKTEDYTTSAAGGNPVNQRGYSEQNKDPQGVRNVQNADRDVQEGTWADDDERYAGGHRKASWEENNEKEHAND